MPSRQAVDHPKPWFVARPELGGADWVGTLSGGVYRRVFQRSPIRFPPSRQHTYAHACTQANGGRKVESLSGPLANRNQSLSSFGPIVCEYPTLANVANKRLILKAPQDLSPEVFVPILTSQPQPSSL